jgi:hypothetical protein
MIPASHNINDDDGGGGGGGTETCPLPQSQN